MGKSVCGKIKKKEKMRLKKILMFIGFDGFSFKLRILIFTFHPQTYIGV